MKLTDLKQCFTGNEDLYREYTVLLVDLDLVPSDGVDVVISPLRETEVDPEAGEIRLYSAAVRPNSDQLPAALFELFMGSWPLDGVHDVEFVVKIQLPIAPEEGVVQEYSLQPLAGVWIGRESEEIWLLVRPQPEYPQDLLPG
ncbi:MAG: hypothetical protein K0Q92_2786 [Steroidobacteraceae bacterium]|nr:hypothetical protein [Steroidobacteraceae bacterium]